MASFIDSVRIHLRGGAGGAGVTSFQKRKGKPRGRPNGGSGGSGGNVVLRVEPAAVSLLRYHRQPHWKAADGDHGEGELRRGRAGSDLVLPVPPGTIVYQDDGVLLADLVADGQELVVGEGGRGGRGNAAFVRPERRAPSFSEQGEYGEERALGLELKLIADAALIGFPNAGKSTLIARVSAARPKIADYPFTTLEPSLGVVEIDDREFVFADIPGLIEGAAQGKGLGHEFLRHTERARVLVMLLDPTPLQRETPADQLAILRSEVGAHSPDLASRPFVVAVNKIDALDGEVPDVRGFEVFPISALTGDGIDALLHVVADRVDGAVRSAPGREGYVLHRPLGETFSVRRTTEGWAVEGRMAERAVNLDDLTVPEAADLVASRLARSGIDAALREAGASAGDDVRIAGHTFTYDPDLADREEKSP